MTAVIKSSKLLTFFLLLLTTSAEITNNNIHASSSILPPDVTKSATNYLNNLTSWIMTLDVGSGIISNYNTSSNPLNTSIFINGNLARVLLGSYKLTGNIDHLHEGLRWCDSFINSQVDVITSKGSHGGYWGAGYPESVPLSQGEIYLGDTGTAATALSICHELTSNATQRDLYEAAMKKYFIFVTEGCNQPGCGAVRRGTASSSGFVNTSASGGGAIGCGFYKGHLSTCPYVIATATTGAAFAGELLSILKATNDPTSEECYSMAKSSIEYIASLVSPTNGTLPYQIDCDAPDWTSWPLDTLSYVTEGATSIWIHSKELRPKLTGVMNQTVEWLLANQNEEGYWGSSSHAADLQRSPRVATMLSLHAAAAAASSLEEEEEVAVDPRLVDALVKYVKFILKSGDGKYGVKDILNTSGFVGLALLDLLEFGITFGRP